MPNVQFYVPRDRMPPPEAARAWKSGARVPLESEGVAATEQAWIYQTYVQLRERGVACELVHEVPQAGVLVAFTNAFDGRPAALRDDVFFVCVVADSTYHPDANWYVVQNRRQVRYAPHCTFLPHWPQPALQPRDPERGATFQNVCYYGLPGNLAPALRSARWRRRLHDETGLTFRVCGPERWHDYCDTDAVVAVRSFAAEHTHLRKPATKLYNAWLAGVPALCGPESALRAERRDEHDYLEVHGPDDVIETLRFLKAHPAFVEKMRAQAARRAQAHTPEAVARRWWHFLADVAQPRQQRWQRAGRLRRATAYAHRKLQRKGRRRLFDFLS